jgi:5-methylcytosine-specific restriction endonuclease McrA
MRNRLKKLRNIAFLAQDRRCFYCDRKMWTGDPSGRALRDLCTAEHLTARCDGGTDTLSNIVAACWPCNVGRHRRKKPLAPESYRIHVRRQLAVGRWQPG